MGIYINMKMPEDSDMIVIYSDDTARKYLSYTRVIIDEAKAVPVPPHGRLIDADALTKKIKRDGIASDPFVKIVCDYFKDAPTIIPASEE